MKNKKNNEAVSSSVVKEQKKENTTKKASKPRKKKVTSSPADKQTQKNTTKKVDKVRDEAVSSSIVNEQKKENTTKKVSKSKKENVTSSLADKQTQKNAIKKVDKARDEVVSSSVAKDQKKDNVTKKVSKPKKENVTFLLSDEQKKEDAIKRANKRLILDTIRLFIILAIATIIFFVFFGIKVVDGNGMYPALMDGDLTLTFNKANYVKNDVVFYRVDGKEYCGRVVAKAGDSISFSEDGKFYVNGMIQSEKIAFPTMIPEGSEKKLIVPDDTVYILGDYRTSCVDSRTLGFISLDDVDSKIIALLRHKKI